MGAFISATSAISPQQTFDDDNYLNEIIISEKPWVSAAEPDYKAYLDPRLTRRMARIIKMSVAASKACLQKSTVEQPGAIIVGTGFGCLQDTEKFLSDLIENKEGLLSPTSFIQSTHNTIAGQIALTLSCPNHNFTFVQRGHSFESALEDGILMVNEGTDHVLIGGVDEITPTLFSILAETDCINTQTTAYPHLEESEKKPSLGEGASFFILSKDQTKQSIAKIEATQLKYKPAADEIPEMINSFLQKNNLDLDDIDAVMMGFNGYKKEDVIYHQLENELFEDKLILTFKNLCGEYFTASAFGHHIAAHMLHKQQVYTHTVRKGDRHKPLGNILLYNHYKMKYHTLTLLSQCPNI